MSVAVRDFRHDRTPIQDRFWAKVDKTPTCWEWTAALNNAGYGTFWDGSYLTSSSGKIRARMVLATRWIYETSIGPVGGFFVLHRCDNPKCVRPDHLFLGRHQTNMLDMRTKGRSGRGARNSQAKLTVEQVIEIRERRRDGELLRLLATDFGVSVQTVSRIVRNELWNGT